MSRSLFTPDHTATEAALKSGEFPPAGVFTRTFVENFLSPGTPRSTFMLQSSARIGCFASNIGVAAGAVIAMSERHGFGNASAVPTMLVQWCETRMLFCAIFILEMMILPRQARDKHRESTQNREMRFCAGHSVPSCRRQSRTYFSLPLTFVPSLSWQTITSNQQDEHKNLLLTVA